MAAHFLPSGQAREWVVFPNVHSLNDATTGTSQTKLLFNEAIPARVSNRATRVRLPAPIVIERLLPSSERPESMDSYRSSISFTALSEEGLRSAIQLAKRDMRRRRLESLTKSPAKVSQEPSVLETVDVELYPLQEPEVKPDQTIIAPSPKKKTGKHGARLSALTSQADPMSRIGQSPPTRDPDPRKLDKRKPAPLSQLILKLQNELEVYVQKVEELANRGEKVEVSLESEEQNKLEIRRQKQATLAARNIYVLQQQVKEIREDIETLQSQKLWDTKKSLSKNRLAAAHRGALRALQVVIHQLSDVSHDGKVVPYYKELGKLIRQLSVCSAKVEVEEGSAVPEMVLDILQKLETLDSTLSKQEMLEKMQAQACPPRRKSHGSMLPSSAPKGPSMSSVQGQGKPTKPKTGAHGRRKHKAMSHQQLNRREILRAGLERLVQQREMKERRRQPPSHTTNRKEGALQSERSKSAILKSNEIQPAGFQQPTVSSQLRVNQLPQRDQSVPWMPTSPHSPPQRSPQRRGPEPRCLFSPVKPSTSSPMQMVAGGLVTEQPGWSSDKRKQAQTEALRIAWLDKMTMQRLKELDQLSKEEAEHIQTLRPRVYSPREWAERAEQKARERIQPLLDEAQAAERAEQPREAPLEDLLEDTTQAARRAEADRQLEDMAERWLQAPTIESMLLRMEEIQRDEEEVRRRNASISYSDPSCWDRPGTAGPQHHATGSGPVCPQPIMLSRPVLTQSSAAHIFLEKPVETRLGSLSESSLTEEASQDEQPPRCSGVLPGGVGQSRRTVISVPGSMLRNIRRYREDNEAYLRVVAHEALGGFNPWAVTDRLADELLSEAVADVVAEFQDITEEYAEAVFTSEFLQPVQSPPASAADSVHH